MKKNKIKEKSKDKNKYVPNVKAHFFMSMIKSIIRIVGYVMLALAYRNINFLWFAGAILFVSEAIGILEEMV